MKYRVEIFDSENNMRMARMGFLFKSILCSLYMLCVWASASFAFQKQLIRPSSNRFAYNQSILVKKPIKIVGLIQVRNEEDVLEHCLRGLAVYTDAIVLLDDNSNDNTCAIAQRLASELHIETIIAQPYSGWQKTSEAHNRQTLLDAGRVIGGTHFVHIDADELFAAPCAHDSWLRNKIKSLVPGQALAFPMVNVWGGAYEYRDDERMSPHAGRWWGRPIVFCDDGQCSYINDAKSTNMLHGSRIPLNRRCVSGKKMVVVTDLNHAIIHFRWANLENIYIKKLWYMMLEYARANEYHNDQEANFNTIVNYYNNNEFIGMMPDEENIRLKPVPAAWYAYPFFDGQCYTQLNHARKKDIKEWIKTYGADYFSSFDAMIIQQ